MLVYTVEAFSQESYDDALDKAMDKATAVLEGHQADAHVAIKALNHSQESGYHAVLEITLVPMSLRDNHDMCGIFKEAKRAHVKDFRLMIKKEHDHLQHVLEDHFAKVKANIHLDTPDIMIWTNRPSEIESAPQIENYYPKPKSLKPEGGE